MILRARFLCGVLILWAVLPGASAGPTDELPEFRLKAAFLYNFLLFTEWPPEIGKTLAVCIQGRDPFGAESDALHGKAVHERHIVVRRLRADESPADCQAVFISASAIGQLARVLDEIRTLPVLTVADSPNAAKHGVALNLAVKHGKVTFEANLAAAKTAGLKISSKLLRLATEVRQ